MIKTTALKQNCPGFKTWQGNSTSHQGHDTDITARPIQSMTDNIYMWPCARDRETSAMTQTNDRRCTEGLIYPARQQRCASHNRRQTMRRFAFRLTADEKACCLTADENVCVQSDSRCKVGFQSDSRRKAGFQSDSRWKSLLSEPDSR